MSYNSKNVIDTDILDIIENGYINYSITVIKNRAIPNVQDGLKNVHRRILFAMANVTKFTKVARVVGDTMGKFHPQGNASIEGALVIMAQDFSKNICLIEGQGNFGSLSGDEAAAPRYIECKLARFTQDYVLKDIYKNAVDFVPNYDASEMEPTCLPMAFCNLLVNGSIGIATGFVSHIPPHNLKEVCKATIALIKNPLLTDEELFKIIPAPDFPTGGIINHASSLEAYVKKEGSSRLRAKIDYNKEKNYLCVSEIAYGTSIENVLESINDASTIINGIKNVKNYSGENVDIRIYLTPNTDPTVVTNLLFQKTKLEITQKFAFTAIKDKNLIFCSLKDIIREFIDFRIITLERIFKFEIDKFQKELSRLSGIHLAIVNIKAVVATIQGSKDKESANKNLCELLNINSMQAEAILKIELSRLISLEKEALKDRISTVKQELKQKEEYLKRIPDYIISEQNEIIKKYGTPRKTKYENFTKMEIDSLIQNDQYYITVSMNGFFKKFTMDSLKNQGRGGKGKKLGKFKEGDYIQAITPIQNRDEIFVFTKNGNVYKKKAFNLPETGFDGIGKHIKNFYQIEESDSIASVVVVPFFKENNKNMTFLFLTKKGRIKQVNMDEFNRLSHPKFKATKLDSDDELFCVKLIQNNEPSKIVITTTKSYGVVFELSEVPLLKRTTFGCSGINLRNDDVVVSMDIVSSKSNDFSNASILTIGSNGIGKITPLSSFNITKRNTKGVKFIKNEETIGSIYLEQDDNSEVVVITKFGKVIKVDHITKTKGKNTKGSTIISLDKDSDDKVVAVCKVFDLQKIEIDNMNNK
jgi:DNA gyrase subunit A